MQHNSERKPEATRRRHRARNCLKLLFIGSSVGCNTVLAMILRHVFIQFNEIVQFSHHYLRSLPEKKCESSINGLWMNIERSRCCHASDFFSQFSNRIHFDAMNWCVSARILYRSIYVCDACVVLVHGEPAHFQSINFCEFHFSFKNTHVTPIIRYFRNQKLMEKSLILNVMWSVRPCRLPAHWRRTKETHYSWMNSC